MGQLVLLMANMAVMIALLMPLEVKGASLEDRAVEEMKLVNVADREMTQFWDTFNTNWDAYKDDKVKNPNRVCTDHVKLLEELEEIKIQNGLVISAIEALKAQLTQIRVILENAEWGDHSGLHCKETPDEPICVALAALDKQADQAETKANGEKDLVLAEITRVKTYDCNCVWEQWAGKWSACSKTCEEGTKKQTREILWQKRNKGQDCNPADGVESAPCNDGCCPVNCVWDDWKPWGDCPNVCSAETQYMLRTREKKVSMECAERGGKECEGSPNERKECKILEVWDGKIAALVTKHNNLKSQIALYKEKLCDPNPCANGGTCNEGVCTCAAEFEGHHCKTPKEKKVSASVEPGQPKIVAKEEVKRSQVAAGVGCETIKDRYTCLTSLDGRSAKFKHYGLTFNGQKCVWCHGKKCDRTGNLCEPENWMSQHHGKGGELISTIVL